MTTVVAPTRTRSATPSLVAVAALLPVGPAAVAVLRLALPYYTADGNAASLAAVEAHPGRQSAVVWLTYVAVLTLVPGLFAAARVCRGAAPRLTAWALALSVPGYLSLGVLAGYDQLLWSVATSDVSATDGAAVLDAAHPTIDISIGVFVLGHVVGTVLLGLALLRSGRVPAWAAWAVTVSQPLHFVATVVLGSPQVDFVAWSLTAVGMAMVARALLAKAPR
ncbi:hypothetical protein [Pedococcus sp. 2YAF34]|uniref:hypothetical protein n=1 Tax=Pedococcus sp. 2YAF34 TaxID=3233032 RepID=UPI003F97C8E7